MIPLPLLLQPLLLLLCAALLPTLLHTLGTARSLKDQLGWHLRSCYRMESEGDN